MISERGPKALLLSLLLSSGKAQKNARISFAPPELLRKVLTRSSGPSQTGVMFQHHVQVVLASPLPALGLEPGDVGVVVHVHGGGAACEVEFMSLDGRTVGVERCAPTSCAPYRPAPCRTNACASPPEQM